MKGGEKLKAVQTLYVSRLLTAGQVKATSRKVKDLLRNGQELQANILMLRYAGQRSATLLRKEVETWQPLAR